MAKFATGDDEQANSFALVADTLIAVESHHGQPQVEELLKLPLPALIRHSLRFVARLLQANGHLLTEDQVRQSAQKSELSKLAASRWQPVFGIECFHSRNGNAHGHATWRIEELCTAEALKKEGQIMNHCVAGYARRCRLGSSAIFSLRHYKTDFDGIVQITSYATIEVHPRTRRIVQIRAERNRIANNNSMTIIQEWANSKGLLC